MFREAYLVKRISYLIASGRYLGGVFIYLMLPRPQVAGLIKAQVIRAQGIEFTFPGAFQVVGIE